MLIREILEVSKMNTDKKHLQNIIKANNDNRLAIFIGAGISKSSETATANMPTWEELIASLKADLGQDKESDFLKIAQLYFLEFGEFTYYEKLRGLFSDGLEPSVIHKLIFDINPQVIVTTNWDTLLEKTIEKYAYIYDVIHCDEDLVKSTLHRKLIKMHGDFKNHNIVFKEDDYINYSVDFPLIENYVKSILSTHTVLFIGYSYSDINLKQIIKWLQNHSKVNPPRYFTDFEESATATQQKYLENHGIKTIVLKDENKYQEINNIKSRKTACFLDLIKNPSDILVDIENDRDVIDFVYNKLIILNDLDAILLGQINNVLTNCGYVYTDDNLVILKFYTDSLTLDYDKETRRIYEKFVTVLQREINNNKINKILELFYKANIDGVVLENAATYFKIDSSLYSESKILNDCLNFDFNDLTEQKSDTAKMMEVAYKYYQLQDYQKSFSLLEEVIVLCLKQRNYTQLLIALFNSNSVLWHLKHDIYERNEIYNDTIEYDLKEKFNNLPKDLQNALEPLYKFLSFDYLFKQLFEVIKDYDREEETTKTIKNGGFSWHNDQTKPTLKHKNLILFILKNKIIIDFYNEYKTINQKFLEISLIRQDLRKSIHLNRFELYSCICFFDKKKLVEVLKVFYNNDCDKILEISDEDIEWLCVAISNLDKNFIQNKKTFNSYEKRFINSIFIASLVNLNDRQAKTIFDSFLHIISENKCTINIYESVNEFLVIQYKLFKTKIDGIQLISFIELMINKLVYRKYNRFDYHVITEDSINTVFNYAAESNIAFDKYDLVDKLLLELTNFKLDEKINFTNSFLLNVYHISDDRIKNLIKTFTLNIEIDTKNKLTHFLFELRLIAAGIKDFDDAIKDKIEIHINNFDKKQKEEMSQRKYSMSFFLDEIKGLLKYFIEQMSHTELQIHLDKVNQLIEVRNQQQEKFNRLFSS